jgi:glycosyltransferase involved in cell wall biosynthesis
MFLGFSVADWDAASRHLTFEYRRSRTDVGQWETLRRLAVEESFSINVPFFDGRGRAISALDVCDAVENLKAICISRGLRHQQEPVDLSALGFEAEDASLEFDTLLDRTSAGHCALSVVSPIYNRCTQMPYFLESLLTQRVAAPYEVILVDDGSTDGSAEVALTLLTRVPEGVSVKLLKARRRRPYVPGTFSFGAGRARELGVRKCRGDRVVFLDPDQLIDVACLQEHLDWGKRGFAVVIGDRQEVDVDVTSPWIALRSRPLSADPYWWLTFFTGNSSVNRKVLREAGSFDPRLLYWGLDDTDLGYRLRLRGASVWRTRRARVVNLDPDCSGGGNSEEERTENFRLHMEVLYRKYLSLEIVEAFRFAWPN